MLARMQAEKLITRLLLMAMAVALSAGAGDDSVGAVPSSAVRVKKQGLDPPPLQYSDIGSDVVESECPPLLAMGG